MLPSILLYAASATVAAGVLALFPRRTRRAGAIACAIALPAAIVILLWPASLKRAAPRATRLDEVVPEWQFAEKHSIHIDAPPERVYAAIRGVTAGEIRLFQTLTSIRRLGCPGPESILNAPEKLPLLDVATRTTFRWYADEPPRELAIGTHVAPRTLAAMNFLLAPDGRGGTHLSTETRVFAATPRGRRAFAMYWRAILPGSDIIRRSWLRAVKKRAEAA